MTAAKVQKVIAQLWSKATLRLSSTCKELLEEASVAVTMGPPVEEVYTLVGGVPTYLLKFGKIQKGKPLMLIIPGNPGVADYYEEFMATLYEEGQRNFPVWCISHAGHAMLPPEAPAPTTNEDYYEVNGQIKHKINFVRDHLPAETPVILIGHSIGAYIIIHMMRHFDDHRIQMGVLLFPTVERMAASPKGSVATPMLRYFGWMASWGFCPIYYLIPTSVQRWIMRWYFGQKNVPECTIKATLKLVEPWAVSNAIYMGRSEMAKVVNADHDIIRANLHRLMFYYGSEDSWCPVSYYQDMKKVHPTGDIRLDNRKMEHAFCLEASQEMAKILWPWLVERIPDLRQYSKYKS